MKNRDKSNTGVKCNSDNKEVISSQGDDTPSCGETRGHALARKEEQKMPQTHHKSCLIRELFLKIVGGTMCCICIIVMVLAIAIECYMAVQLVKQEITLEKAMTYSVTAFMIVCSSFTFLLFFMILSFMRNKKYVENTANNKVDNQLQSEQTLDTSKILNELIALTTELNQKMDAVSSSIENITRDVESDNTLCTKIDLISESLEQLLINLPSEGSSFGYLSQVYDKLQLAQRYQADAQMSIDDLLTTFNNVQQDIKEALEIAQKCIDSRKRK